jgi:hypothetical protein
VLHALAVTRLAEKARDGSAILAQLLAQHLDRDGPVIGVPRPKDGRGAALADLGQQFVSGDILADKILPWHAANLTVSERRGKQTGRRVHYGVTTAARLRVSAVPSAVWAAALLLATGCLVHHRAPPAALPLGPLERAPTPVIINASDVYRRAGYLVASGEIQFVAAVHAFAGPTPDSTRVVIALSFPNRDLQFARDGEQYRAAYDVSYGVRAGHTLVARRTAHSEVRVASFRETTRTEESVLVQQPLTLPCACRHGSVV